MRLALIHSQQPGNQYAGGPTGQTDSEQAWMRRLALAVAPLLTAAGVDVEVSPLGTSYASNVAWVNSRHLAKPFDLVVSFHSNAMGDSCILYGTSKASRGYAERFRAILNAAKIVPAGDAWTFNERKVAEVANTTPPAVLLEWHRHDTLAGAAWLRQRINDGTLATGAARAILDALGVKPPASSSKIPAGAIVMVAGAGNTMLDKLSGKYRRRLDVALELVKGTDTKILVTGGRKTGRPTPEATRAAEYLTGKGIPASRILTETLSGSTNGNFSLGMPIAAKAGAKSVVVVSDQSHMRRCLSMAYASAKKHSLDLPISGAHWYPDSTTQDATVLQATQQARDIWAGMAEQIVRDLDVKWGIAKAPVAPGVAPKFPLPAGYYFGPKEPTSNARAVSGYFGRKFSGETDRTWLKLWQTQAKKAGIYTGQIDGLYGPATATAARAVQQRRKLAVDGLIGKDTWPAAWQL